MIDIHTHVLPFVDDGSESLSQSLEMVKTACEQGVTDMFLTPHRRHEYNTTPEETIEVFNNFKKEVEKLDLPINLYLGNEIFYKIDTVDKLLKSHRLTMNNSKYVLIEFSTTYPIDVEEAVYKILRAGFIPIIAHVERYRYFTAENYFEVKKMGALLQVNADAIVGKEKRRRQKTIDFLFKQQLVDFVASDYHANRPNLLKEAYRVIEKRFGEEAAQVVFNLKAKEIIKG